MKLGMRKPSLKKSLAARTSSKRIIKNSLGLRAPRGSGMILNPKKAVKAKIYRKTTFSLWGLLGKLFR
ncbi:MAG: hypothetical protein KJ587_18265 [Alphaproteobacteria bacterium]|nr:hypothetical protein [Alphaproteobacteria bacterium]